MTKPNYEELLKFYKKQKGLKGEFPNNKEILERYLNTYKHSDGSVAMRKSSLNYFFKTKYYGYDKHIFEIDKSELIDYFNWLNHLEGLTLQTKKNKWTILRSLLQFSMEYYEHPKIILPKHTIKWKKVHKKSPKKIYIDKDEIYELLEYLFLNNYQYYLITRLFLEAGFRKSGLIDANYNNVNINKRYIESIEKTGRVVYYFSKDYRPHLKAYLKDRKKMQTNTKALFISQQRKRYSDRAFNQYFEDAVIPNLSYNKNITCQVFRRSLNNLRESMGCPPEKRAILLNQQAKDDNGNTVNFSNYVQKDYQKFINYYDQWYPYNPARM